MARPSKFAHLSNEELLSRHDPLDELLPEKRRRGLVPPATPTQSQINGGHKIAESRRAEAPIWRDDGRLHLFEALEGVNLLPPLPSCREQVYQAVEAYDWHVAAPSHYVWKQQVARWVAVLKNPSHDPGMQLPKPRVLLFLRPWYAVWTQAGAAKADAVLTLMMAAVEQKRAARQKDRAPSAVRTGATDAELCDSSSGRVIYDDLSPWEARRELNRRARARYRAKKRST